MEYKIFKYIRHNIKIPILVRWIIAIILIIISLIPIFLPIFPGSIFIGIIFLVTGLLLIIPGCKIKYVVKIRKGIIFLGKNFHKKDVIKLKILDIKTHIRDILNKK